MKGELKNKLFAVFAVVTICAMIFTQLGVTTVKADGPANVIIDYGDGTYDYSTVTLTSPDITAFNATEQAATSLGVSWSSYGAYIYMINDVYPSGNEWWVLYIWNTATDKWELSSVGASSLNLASGDTIGWVLDPNYNVAPTILPMDPRAVSTSVTTFTLSAPPSDLAIGSTFTVTASVTNAVDVKSCVIQELTWNPAVLSFVDIAYGSFISDPMDLGAAGVDNVAGVVGEIVVQSSSATGYSGSGDFVTLTFQVMDFGDSNIVITSGVARDTSDVDMYTQNLPTTYDGLEPSPYGPTAIITTPEDDLWTLLDSVITMNGQSSLNGFDGSAIDYIWYYNWEILDPSSAVAYSGQSWYEFDITLDQVGDWTITLEVVTGLGNTDSVTHIVHVVAAPTGPSIDLYTQRGGEFANVSSDAFGPQELILLYANVTYNNVGVVGKDVTFEIRDADGELIAIRTARTNADGVASAEYRLPWPDVNPEDTFGTWTITATVDISEVVVVDVVGFTFDYILEITCVETLTVSNVAESSFARDGQMKVEVTVSNIRKVAVSGELCITIYDEADVPIMVAHITLTVPASTSAADAFTLTIPHYAFVGQATVYANILTQLPSLGGVPFCPEDSSAQFTITA